MVELRDISDIGAGTVPGDEKIFDFFGLPRELRDKVYDESLHDEHVLSWSENSLRVRLRGVPHTDIVLVSRQFSAECLERAAKLLHVIVEDQRHYNGEQLDLPERVRNAPSIELHLALFCDGSSHVDAGGEGICEIEMEYEMHSKVVPHILDQLPHLRSLSIYLYVDKHEASAECVDTVLAHQSSLLDKLVKIRNTAHIEVYQLDLEVGDDAWDFLSARKLIMKYCHQARKLVRMEAKNEDRSSSDADNTEEGDAKEEAVEGDNPSEEGIDEAGTGEEGMDVDSSEGDNIIINDG